ncbi:hypothetical protein AB1N83_013629 [Pleurotus pulmonarius]
MTTTEPPIPPKPNDISKTTAEPDIVDFDEDPADNPFDPEASTLTSMRTLTPDDKRGRDCTTKPVPRPGLRYISVSDEAPHYFIFTEPDSKQKYKLSRVDAWAMIDIAADLAAGVNVGFYVRNTPPLYNIVASIVNKEPELPNAVQFPVIESNGLVSHSATFPPGPFIFGLRDHTPRLKFNKKKAPVPASDSAPPPRLNHKQPPRQRGHREIRLPRLERSPSLADTSVLDRLLTSSSTTGTFLAHSVINYGQTLERDLQRAQRANQPRHPSRSAPFRRAYRPRPPRARPSSSQSPKATPGSGSSSPSTKHDDTAMQVDEDRVSDPPKSSPPN